MIGCRAMVSIPASLICFPFVGGEEAGMRVSMRIHTVLRQSDVQSVLHFR